MNKTNIESIQTWEVKFDQKYFVIDHYLIVCVMLSDLGLIQKILQFC